MVDKTPENNLTPNPTVVSAIPSEEKYSSQLLDKEIKASSAECEERGKNYGDLRSFSSLSTTKSEEQEPAFAREQSKSVDKAGDSMELKNKTSEEYSLSNENRDGNDKDECENIGFGPKIISSQEENCFSENHPLEDRVIVYSSSVESKDEKGSKWLFSNSDHTKTRVLEESRSIISRAHESRQPNEDQQVRSVSSAPKDTDRDQQVENSDEIANVIEVGTNTEWMDEQRSYVSSQHEHRQPEHDESHSVGTRSMGKGSIISRTYESLSSNPSSQATETTEVTVSTKDKTGGDYIISQGSNISIRKNKKPKPIAKINELLKSKGIEISDLDDHKLKKAIDIARKRVVEKEQNSSIGSTATTSRTVSTKSSMSELESKNDNNENASSSSLKQVSFLMKNDDTTTGGTAVKPRLVAGALKILKSKGADVAKIDQYELARAITTICNESHKSCDMFQSNPQSTKETVQQYPQSILKNSDTATERQLRSFINDGRKKELECMIAAAYVLKVGGKNNPQARAIAASILSSLSSNLHEENKGGVGYYKDWKTSESWILDALKSTDGNRFSNDLTSIDRKYRKQRSNKRTSFAPSVVTFDTESLYTTDATIATCDSFASIDDYNDDTFRGFMADVAEEFYLQTKKVATLFTPMMQNLRHDILTPYSKPFFFFVSHLIKASNKNSSSVKQLKTDDGEENKSNYGDDDDDETVVSSIYDDTTLETCILGHSVACIVTSSEEIEVITAGPLDDITTNSEESSSLVDDKLDSFLPQFDLREGAVVKADDNVINDEEHSITSLIYDKISIVSFDTSKTDEASDMTISHSSQSANTTTTNRRNHSDTIIVGNKDIDATSVIDKNTADNNHLSKKNTGKTENDFDDEAQNTTAAIDENIISNMGGVDDDNAKLTAIVKTLNSTNENDGNVKVNVMSQSSTTMDCSLSNNSKNSTKISTKNTLYNIRTIGNSIRRRKNNHQMTSKDDDDTFDQGTEGDNNKSVSSSPSLTKNLKNARRLFTKETDTISRSSKSSRSSSKSLKLGRFIKKIFIKSSAASKRAEQNVEQQTCDENLRFILLTADTTGCKTNTEHVSSRDGKNNNTSSDYSSTPTTTTTKDKEKDVERQYYEESESNSSKDEAKKDLTTTTCKKETTTAQGNHYHTAEKNARDNKNVDNSITCSSSCNGFDTTTTIELKRNNSIANKTM